MKRIFVVILLLAIISITGCTKEKEIVINNKPINTSKMAHKHCTRDASLTDGEVTLEYDIYYTGDILNILKSYEKVSSSDSSILDTYEEAYKNIHSNYDGLAYYDTSVERNNESVTSTIIIDYDEIDIAKLISIEGEEDNIFENNKAMVNKWLDLGKKFGMKCELIKE